MEVIISEFAYFNTIFIDLGGGGGIPMEDLQRQNGGSRFDDPENLNEESMVTKEPDADPDDPFTKPTSGGLLAMFKYR